MSIFQVSLLKFWSCLLEQWLDLTYVKVPTQKGNFAFQQKKVIVCYWLTGQTRGGKEIEKKKKKQEEARRLVSHIVLWEKI